MALVNRASLPEEFFDVTSAMLLVQPEPAFFHALLLKMALTASLALPFGGPLGIPVPGRPIADAGAPYTSAESDRLMLAVPDPAYKGAVLMPKEIGQQVGHTVKLNRPKYANSTYTLGSREIPSGTSISTTAVDVASEQVPLTVKRYGGPYDNVQGAVAPYAVDKFDSTRSVHSESQIVGTQLQRDLDKWVDQVLVTMGNLATTTLWPQSYASDNASNVAGDMAFDVDTVFRVEETLKNGNVPRYPNGKYMGVIGPTDSRQLKNDPQFATYAKDNPYAGQTNPLFQNFIARIGGIDIFESSSLIATNNSNSVPVRSSQFFGAGVFGAGFGRLPETAYNTQDNFGESALVIWLTYMAIGLLDQRFVVNVHCS